MNKIKSNLKLRTFNITLSGIFFNFREALKNHVLKCVSKVVSRYITLAAFMRLYPFSLAPRLLRFSDLTFFWSTPSVETPGADGGFLLSSSLEVQSSFSSVRVFFVAALCLLFRLLLPKVS